MSEARHGARSHITRQWISRLRLRCALQVLKADQARGSKLDRWARQVAKLVRIAVHLTMDLPTEVSFSELRVFALFAPSAPAAFICPAWVRAFAFPLCLPSSPTNTPSQTTFSLSQTTFSHSQTIFLFHRQLFLSPRPFFAEELTSTEGWEADCMRTWIPTVGLKLGEIRP